MSQSPLVPGKSKQLDTYLESMGVLNRMIVKGSSYSGRERNCCFLNTGKMPFANVSATSGIDWADDTRGAAIVDWDRDGDLDFWASNRTGPRVRLMRNNSPPGDRFLRLSLQGTQPGCNRDAIGARVELWTKTEADAEAPLHKRIKTLYAGNGFLSQSSKWIHFGLPPKETVDHLVIRWPDGLLETLRDLQAGTSYQILQGKGATVFAVESDDTLESPQLPEGPLPQFKTSDAMRTVLARRQLLPLVEYTNLVGERVNLEDLEAPLLINLWADWCQPCVKELKEFSQHTQQFEEAGLHVVALHVGDPKGNREGVAKVAVPLLERLQFRQSAGVADLETIKMLDTMCETVLGLHRELPLPSSFLLDRSKRVCVLYKGPVSVEQLLADVKAIGSVDEKWLEDAASFAGVWDKAPSSYESLQMVRKLLKAGRVKGAIDYLMGCIDHAKKLAEDQDGPDPALAAMYHILGTIYRTTNRLPQAIPAYQQALKVDPEHWAAHFDLGTICLKNQQYGAAGEYFAEALRIKPEDADMLSKMALVQMGQARLEEAAPFLEKALELEPNNEAALRNLATVHMKLKHPRQAVPYLTKLLQVHPDSAPLRLELGHSLHQIGQLRDALVQYRKALELHPDWIPPMNAAAWLLATREGSTEEEISEAVQLAEKVCQLVGRPRPSALDTLAAALAAAGRFEEAIEAAQEALEIVQRANAKPLVEKYLSRLRLYRQQRPYRESETQEKP